MVVSRGGIARAVLAFGLALACGLPSGATIYAYTDAQGRIRITDIPEKDGQVIVLPRIATPSTPAAASAATAVPRRAAATSYAAPRSDRDPQAFRHSVSEAAQLYKLSESIIYAVMKAESNFNPYAVSRAGAQGLMQLIPSTARLVGVNDTFDPRQNIMGGAKYLRMMLDRFGRLDLALAAYNAGPEAVQRHRGIPPYSETLNYVPRVLKFYREFGGAGELMLSALASSASTPRISTAPRRARAGANRTPSAADVPVISRANAPIFYFRGPDGQIYISNIR